MCFQCDNLLHKVNNGKQQQQRPDDSYNCGKDSSGVGKCGDGNSKYFAINLHTIAMAMTITVPVVEAAALRVRTLNNGYLRKVPLPRVPHDQSTIPVVCTATHTVNAQATSYLSDPWIPLHDNLKRLLLDVSKLVLAPLSPRWLMYSHQMIRRTICLVFSYLLLVSATDQG